MLIHRDLLNRHAHRIRDEWSQSILGRAGEVDKDEVTNLVHAMYSRTGVNKPPVVIQCASPIAALMVRAVLKGGFNINTWEQVFTGSMAPRESTYDAPTIVSGIRLNIQEAVLQGVVLNGTPKSPRSTIKFPNMKDIVRAMPTHTTTTYEAYRHIVWGQRSRRTRAGGWASLGGIIWAACAWAIEGTKIMGPWETVVDTHVAEKLGTHWTAWAEWLFCVEPELQSLNKIYRPMIQLNKSCMYWIPYQDVCIVVANPVKVRQDDQQRLHCDFEPAVRFADGWSLYSWHNVSVPSAWIIKSRPHGLTPQKALQIPNIEARRAACEIVGWDKILRELKARVIDRDPNPQIGTLLEVVIPGVSWMERFLQVQCGTGRTFALPVPPNVQTAREANAWTYGLAANEYNPEVRT